jgi:hypothetical protein
VIDRELVDEQLAGAPLRGAVQPGVNPPARGFPPTPSSAEGALTRDKHGPETRWQSSERGSLTRFPHRTAATIGFVKIGIDGEVAATRPASATRIRLTAASSGL